MTELDRAKYLLGGGEVEKALIHFEKHLAVDLESEEGRLLRAVCLARLRRIVEAKEAFDALIEDQPDCYDALTWMAELAKGEGSLESALQWAARAADLAPERPEAYGIRGSCHMRLGQSELAISALERAVALAPEVPQYHHVLALSYIQAHRQEIAIEHFRRAITLAPRNPQSYLALSSAYSRYGLVGKALDVLKEGLSNLPNHAVLHSAAAEAFTLIRNDLAAEAHHRRAVELAPDARSAYALWLIDQGRYDEALEIYGSLIKENPRLGVSYYGILQCRKLTQEDEPLVSKMDALLEDPEVAPLSRMYVSYALGKVHEQRKNYEEAIKHYDQANLLAYGSQPYADRFSIDALQEDTDRVVQCFEDMGARGTWGTKGPAPIFIVGMIRSGTTLLDQIVSSHPLVSNAGELRFWIEKSQGLALQGTSVTEDKLREVGAEYLDYIRCLVGDCGRSTDKMPLNFFYLGIIHRAFPDARFLHIRRHPVDTCLSIYTTYFGTGSQFVYNRGNTVAYYKEYLRMMGYWRERLPANRLLELDYEDLITNPEPLIRRVVDFCDLPWDEACLHHEDNKSAINTPSRWQARQPMYRTSMERWRNYEPWLGEFGALLDGPTP